MKLQMRYYIPEEDCSYIADWFINFVKFHNMIFYGDEKQITNLLKDTGTFHYSSADFNDEHIEFKTEEDMSAFILKYG